MKNPLFSIIIVAGYDRKKEIMRCIGSVYKSTHRNFEIIVTNNSGNPGLLKEINDKFPRVRTIELIDNTGVNGFNVGYANAKGDYLLGIDDDCTLRPDTLTNFITAFSKRPKNVGVLVAVVHNPYFNINWNQDKIDANIVNRYSFFEGASAFRKEVFAAAGYYDRDFFMWQHGDDLSIRILSAGYRIEFEKTAVIDHYHREYKDNKRLRNFRAYLDYRNFVWFMVKHFSPIFFLPITARHAVSFINLTIRYKSLGVMTYAIAGYLAGWLTLSVPLKKRKTASFDLQKKFLRYYLFNQHLQN